eukprot:CAMPEP_0197012304 /NCGR_PEP_ID=MMETSP1380-20130617/62017_1 /TAXON_ID=5936 /ORGANISM="Euplotes crassus, Strain CT5" /LENGTH=275 /DNA_ID=CAMNT_0042435679 /DNA_START=6 /DNA_END=833 /DNA_ORIENTATION=-
MEKHEGEAKDENKEKLKKKLSPEEALARIQMEKIEEERLNQVFHVISSKSKKPSKKKKKKDEKDEEDDEDKMITPADLILLMNDMMKKINQRIEETKNESRPGEKQWKQGATGGGKDFDSKEDVFKKNQVQTPIKYKLSKSDAELMVWEVDDDADGKVSKEEFIKMYKRCKDDKNGLEPRKLFNLAYFLMFKPEYTGFVTEEDTLELLFVRYSRAHLDDEINAIFGDERSPIGNDDFVEREISFPEYIKKVNERAMKERKERKEAKKRRDDELMQ